jgi:thiamine-phosphate pyrophosphorylase
MRHDQMNRIVDVNLNRACEGLRVLEDVARFICNCPKLTMRLKEQRHELRKLFASEIQGATRSRNVRGDVGKAPSIIEEDRMSILSIASCNAKRVEEALRSLEEMAKLGMRSQARQAKKMRFAVYGLEQELQDALSQGKGLQGRGIYVVLPDTTEKKIMNLVRQLADAPIAAIQLRCKNLPDVRLLELAKHLSAFTRKHGMQCIINDRVDIALAAGADGVHVGQDDMPLGAIRKITDFSFTVGVSTHSLSEALRAEKEGADYIAFGSIFPTASKEHAVVQGISKLKRITGRITIPVVAIGGISDKNTESVASAGAGFAAVLSYLSEASDPARAARKLHRAFRKGKKREPDRG